MNILSRNLPKIIAVLFAVVLLVWAAGCPATVASPLDPSSKLTRAELQIELDMLLASYENKMTTLDQEERLRKLILQNGILIAQTGSVDPLGILTALFAFYGAGTAVQATAKIVKKKLIK